MIKSFVDLLHPHDPGLLLAAAASGTRLMLRTDRAGAFTRLMSWERLNELITAEKVLSGDIEFARRDMILPAEMTIVRPKRQKPPTRMHSQALTQYARQGISTVINGLDRMDAEVDRVSTIIQREFRASTHVNLYASFGRESAFSPHWDSHNVLILHLHGRKRWRSWGQPWQAPLCRDACKVPGDLGEPEWEAVLEPGDLLYLPRGEIHAATLCEGEDSLHLTIGIVPPRIEALTKMLAEKCQEETVGRQDIPILASAEERNSWLMAAKALLHKAVEGLDLDQVLMVLDQREEPLPAGGLGIGRHLQRGTLILCVLRRRVPMTSAADGSVEIIAGSQRWVIDGLQQRIFSQVQQHHACSIAELAALLSDEREDDICRAIQLLAGKGLVRIKNGASETLSTP